jgi:AbrB family transcriptional regulator (stage V sporulation protein T)
VKATGVLRRIDDLGRIVIPKEIRKNLKIRDGEPLEILVNDSDIILRKHSLINDINNIATICLEAFNKTNANILVTDREKVITGVGPLKKKYLDKEISSDIINAIFKRNTFKEIEEKDFYITKEEQEKGRYIIEPIIASGDPVGSVILLTSEPEISDADEKFIHFVSTFLGKYIE